MNNFDYFDLSVLSVDNIQPLRDFVRKMRKPNGGATFKVFWKDPSFYAELNICKNHPSFEPLLHNKFVTTGMHDFDIRTKKHSLIVRNFGTKQKNNLHHTGGLVATIIHEWCHAIQCVNAQHGVGEWYWNISHPQQDVLYERYRRMCYPFYASVSAEEMAAEAFRVLNGFTSSAPWEKDEDFLSDWKDFFTSDEIFAFHFNY